MEILKPRGAATIRRPTDDNQKNGQIINPHRFSHFGGLSSAVKAGFKNMMTMSRPGDTKKVI